jgi:molybdenum cofactor synthesis domain-containing protein
MIPLPEARAVVLTDLAPLEREDRALAEAVGQVLAEPVRAAEDLPRFANSAMDGYALVAADTTEPPVRLAVVGEILAGDGELPKVGPGQAARIMTGAPLPPGADAVCMVEQTRAVGDGAVEIEVTVTPGTHVRRPGEDVEAGTVVFEAGTVLSPAHIGVLASLGYDVVPVHRRPVVAVVSTGNELTDEPGPLPPGRIRDANRPSLLARLAADGFPTVDLGAVPDDEAAVADVLRRATASADAVVTSGGVSVGDRDVVRMVLDASEETESHWMQVAIKPAKPFAFARLGPARTPLFGLPGNPVSALVSYELFVRPALRVLAGHRRLDRPVLAATLRTPIRRAADGKLHLVRVRTATASDGGLVVEPASGQGSHQLRSMADANGLALVPDGPGLEVGATVAVLLVDEGRLAAEDGSRLGLGPGYEVLPPW